MATGEIYDVINTFDPSGYEVFDAFRAPAGADSTFMTHAGTAGSFGFGGAGGSATRIAGGLRLVSAPAEFYAWVWFPGGDNTRQLNFDAIMSSLLVSTWQASIIGVRITLSAVVTPGSLKIELKDQLGGVEYTSGSIAVSTPTTISRFFPSGMDPIREFLILSENGADFTISLVEFNIQWTSGPHRLIDFAAAVTLNQLLSCYDPATGKVRDKKDLAVDQLDNPSAGGLLCMAAAAAASAGFMPTINADAVITAVVNWLSVCPKSPSTGLPAHFVTSGAIAPGSQYGTVDGAIAYLGAAIGARARGLTPVLATVDSLIDAIDWSSLIDVNNFVSHGTDDMDAVLPSVWDYFGGESLLVFMLAAYQDPATYASRFALAATVPPVFGKRGFIGEIGALFTREMASMIPFTAVDGYGVDWGSMRDTLLADQKLATGGPVFGGLSEAEYLLSNGNFSYQALGASPVVDTIGGEMHFACTDYRCMAMERDLAFSYNDLTWAHTERLLTTIGGLAQSFRHDGFGVIYPTSVNWRVSAIRAAFSFLGLYAALERVDTTIPLLVTRTGASSNLRFQSAIQAQFFTV